MFDPTRYSSPFVVRSWGSLLAAALILFVACTPSSPPPAAETPEVMATGAEKGDPIPWFEGTVEEAFALAKQERKPVFLYWGAVWCPPCHVLRTKLFTRPDFQARLAATVPVYLDGDTERAQIWGEKLHTLGYPTVIIFDADGNEV
ncbi:MAG TPA: thioredoxin family protein, partial [Thermoanaerobaculia bacterium]|nr:thioredoxin family protein [Thermoanaerobaculia bacterium]